MRPMRRTDRLLSHEDALQILNKGEYGILATAGSDSQPYGVPLSYVVIDNKYIYYHATNAGGTKQDNISQNDKVSFTVVGATKVLPADFATLYESTIVIGKASIVLDEEERKNAFMEFVYKYSPEYAEEGKKYMDAAGGRAIIVKISIDEISGKGRK